MQADTPFTSNEKFSEQFQSVRENVDPLTTTNRILTSLRDASADLQTQGILPAIELNEKPGAQAENFSVNTGSGLRTNLGRRLSEEDVRRIGRETSARGNAERTQRDTFISQDVSTQKEAPKVGDKVSYKGESLRVGAYAGEHVLLYENGRNANYAMWSIPVSAEDLKTKYQEIKISMNGKETAWYIEKGHP